MVKQTQGFLKAKSKDKTFPGGKGYGLFIGDAVNRNKSFENSTIHMYQQGALGK